LKFKNVLGNRIEVSEEVNDKLNLAKKLQTLGYLILKQRSFLKQEG